MKRVHGVAAGLALLLAPAAVNPGLATARPTGHPQPIDYVIQRALAQRGVPYVYGGGNASGPTGGIRPSAGTPPSTGTLPATAIVPGTSALPGTGATTPGTTTPGTTTVGFDASGLIQYAFAAAGLKMPRTSGEQCNVGHKIPPAQARRGDLICFGPGGSQSVAMYLGNRQMVEATEPTVMVVPVRTDPRSPYLTRIIE